ncbi:hypothetical protein [Azospirillum thermophilum]|uniref:hypothetical protein n=1 Tax=Azospirillum thermophilum TaxID=2202148 RepID=UPI0011B81141|nr:hypothetical protein [Azospirillum thermophilum]
MGSHTPSEACASTLKPTLNLRVEPEMAREFRVEAARRGMQQNELFEEMWKLYKDAQHGAA